MSERIIIPRYEYTPPPDVLEQLNRIEASLDALDAEEKERREDFKVSRREMVKNIRRLARSIQEQGTRE